MRALGLLCAFGLASAPLMAKPESIPSSLPAAVIPPIQKHWECVPIARALSGIQIFGNAHTWWGQAEGRYNRGSAPKRGSVLAFKPHGSMRLGHVAAVSRVLDERTVLLTHSNWSLINGRRGQIERNVKAIDVSPGNDWSQVKVWFTPLMDLGTTAWPTHGFIYPDGPAPMALPANARVAATMAGPVMNSDLPSTKIAKKAEMPKQDRKDIEKAEKKAAKEQAKLAKKEAKKQDKVAAISKPIAPTGRLDYLGKLLRKLP